MDSTAEEMAMTLSLLRKIDRRLDAVAGGGSTENRLEQIRVEDSSDRQGGYCMVYCGIRDYFVSYWFDDADEMTNCLEYIKGLMKPESNERDLYEFAFAIFNQNSPRPRDIVWLYFCNLDKLFKDVNIIKTIEFWESLLSGMNEQYVHYEPISMPDALLVYESFDVKIQESNGMIMIYVGSTGEGHSLEYLSVHEKNIPILKTKNNPEDTAFAYLYYPAWRNGHNLKWIEPSRISIYLDERLSIDALRSILDLFKDDTSYTVIGSTFNICMQLCPKITSDSELHYRSTDGIHRAFCFEENPLQHAINSKDFVLNVATAAFRGRNYRPIITETDMECCVPLNFEVNWEHETTEVYYVLQNGANNNTNNITINISYKGVVKGRDFIIIRSTRTEEGHSEASTAPNSDAEN